MRIAAVLVGCLFLMGGVACGQTPTLKAKAVIVNGQGTAIGSATLEEAPGGVKIHLEVSQFPPGAHAFHIHAVGKCDPPDFKSAGPHSNPYGKKHGMKNPEGAHAGDLPNITAGPDGKATADVVVSSVTLKTGPNSLFHSDGTALVIHANVDDDVTDPAGNAGARIACGVIEKAGE
jgi:Cu-Zn family superoxide dismutase